MMAPRPEPWRRPPRAGLVLVVMALHALLVWGWWSGLTSLRRSQPPAAQQQPLLVRDVRIVPITQVATATAPLVVAATTPTNAPPAKRPRPSSTIQADKNAPRATGTMPITAPTPDAANPPQAPTALAVPTAPPGASAPINLTLPGLPRSTDMRGRGALTEAQGSMRQLALNDPRSNARADPTQQLPDAVAAAGKGDCLKGEFFGAGMGLLSAPFLAAAAATGHCKPQR